MSTGAASSPSLPAASRPAGMWGRLRRLLRLQAPTLRTNLEDVLTSADSHDPGFTVMERTMLSNILGLREVRVADVMVPRADIVAVEDTENLGALLNAFREAGHSRLPVYRDTLDDPIGFVNVRDLLSLVAAQFDRKDGRDGRQVDLSVPVAKAGIVRPLLFVPPSMPAMDLLVKMQAARVHLALVIDEYGGTDGLLSIEDLIEEVVGEIEDEHDEDIAVITPTDKGWIANARAPLDEVRAHLGPDFSVEHMDAEIAEEVDTLGGLVSAMLGRVPARGELIKGPPGFEFDILDADPRRVKKLNIRKVAATTAGAPAQRPTAADNAPPGT